MSEHRHRGYGATAARLTPDQKVGSSNLSGLISCALGSALTTFRARAFASISQELEAKRAKRQSQSIQTKKQRRRQKGKIPPGKEDFQVMKT